MASRARSLLVRARRLGRPDGVIFLSIIGDPECVKRGVPMSSPREAMVGDHYLVAAPDETTETFHERLRKLVRANNSDGRAYVVLVGHPDNAKPNDAKPDDAAQHGPIITFKNEGRLH